MDRLSERTLQQTAFLAPTTPYSINELLGFEQSSKVCIPKIHLFWEFHNIAAFQSMKNQTKVELSGLFRSRGGTPQEVSKRQKVTVGIICSIFTG